MTDTVLSRLLELRAASLTPADAEFLLTIRFPESDVEQMNRLSELAQWGALSAEQEAELDSYIHVGNLLALMQSRARKLMLDLGRGIHGKQLHRFFEED